MNPQLYTAYPTNNTLRRSFCRLAEQTFGIDFEPWYQAGFWGQQYRPYSLVENREVIANVSVNIMDMCLHGQQKRFIQLGTVMTEEAHRGQGLSRFLMERILEEWKPQCDGVYLFANDSVLNFYPKFGFRPAQEWTYTKPLSAASITAPLPPKLDMSEPANQRRLKQAVLQSVPQSALAMHHNTGLVLFYALSVYRESVYVLDSCNALVMADCEDGTLYVHDIIAPHPVSLNAVIDAFAAFGARQVVLEFIPNDAQGFAAQPLCEEDTTLFLLGDFPEWEQERLRFPALSHA